ncbi:LysR family transcriptional regulator [Candidimonas sp. SYP-B2681]|uniref:LysR family transcriptional regulator n=1 Tax=Candidimonas sp. SYP-B2681 TaxID=2497686 RepID=UPI000F86A7E1|nr:LysR family transcriptional regulator [Candidimonas sp. SYP-B2681]RTZ40044.1 LysR family transcriptional regulator [Candidimonas sp. SYP-B2681]
MRDLDLTTLRMFVTVCEMRSIARAAEQSNIVGSAISKRLAALEENVGVSLLTRRRHGVSPTAAGETLLEHARAMLASAERIRRDMAAYSTGVRGQVRILATASSLAEFLPEDLAAFLQKPDYRNIQIDIEERLSLDVVRGIKEGVASVGICWDLADFQGLETRAYRTDRLAVVVHPDHPLASLKTMAFEASLDYEHVSLSSASAVQIILKRQASLAGRQLVERIFVSNLNAVLRVVLANLAISVVPIEVAQVYADAKGLRVIPLTDTWAQRRFAICFRGESSLSPAARLLVDHLAAFARPDSREP